jgi:FAD/FMN-containing dehydrogenase
MTQSNRQAIEGLRASLRGQLVLPEDASYDETRSIWNGMIDRRPAAIARCLGVGDVLACVNLAREAGLTLCIRGGGHNIAGLAVRDDALMVDMSLMRGVWVDPEGRVARAQAGCVLGDVDRETQLHGLSAVLGFVSNTGIAGLTLGGGFGYLTQKHGWTSDNVRAMEVVTADGKLVRASEDVNADLFWGLRGGGGNFGVVTGFEYELYPVGPEIVGGAVAWRGEDAPAVLDLYRSVLETAPPELACVAALRIAPPAPWLPADVHGRPIVALFVCHTGPIDRAESDVAHIKAFGSPVGDILQRRSYVSQQSLIDATQPNGRRYYWKSEYLPGVEEGLCAALVDQAERIQSPHSAILLFPLGGALNTLPQEHSAVGNRDARAVVNIAAAWDSPDHDDNNIEWARGAWRDARPYSTGGTYLNFLTEEEGDERVRSALGSNYERLTQVKARWDPHNLFRANKNIAPARAG